MVEDDESQRALLQEVLTGSGYEVLSFATGSSFLQHIEAHAEGDGVARLVVIDVHLGDECGIEVQRTVRSLGIHLPFVFISGDQNAVNVNQAWRDGALNFVFKPYKVGELLHVLENAFASSVAGKPESSASLSPDLLEKFNRLSPRQKEVLKLVASGLSNTMISAQIGISPRTVKMHRESLMHRLGFNHVTDLVRFNDACKDLL